MSPGPWLGLGLDGMELGLEDNWSDGIFSLGLGAEDDDREDEDDGEALGVKEELGLLVDSLDMELGMSPELRPGLELP